MWYRGDIRAVDNGHLSLRAPKCTRRGEIRFLINQIITVGRVLEVREFKYVLNDIRRYSKP